MSSISNTHNASTPRFALVALLSGILCQAAFAWTVSGTVKNASGTGLSGVVVTVKDSTKYRTTTGSNGTFTLTSSTAILGSQPTRGAGARIEGNAFVVEGAADGPLELSLVSSSGRSVWSARTTVSGNSARVPLPTHLSRGAVFLRIRQADGVVHQAATLGGSGLELSPVAGRTAASYPVLQFTFAGYTDTTFAMTSETQSGISVTMVVPSTCALPTTFKWKDNASGAIATPKNGWASIKDFTSVVYNGKHIVYMSMYSGSAYGSAAMSPFTNWSDAAAASQTKMNTSTVAPELMYFAPKNTWILSYQWCGQGKFCYMTSTDPTNPSGWTGAKALLTENIVTNSSTGPIDQVVICDTKNCYLFYNGDNGQVYRASMAIGSFPGTFSGSKSIMQDTQARLFEAVEIYTVQGQNKYLMIVEAMGSGGRYFRAFTATDLGGTWTAIPGAESEATPFAGKRNVTFSSNWTNDISHGDVVRSHDQTRTIDPCNLQMLYQGYNPSFTGAYDLKPYRLGLLTFQK